jgi:lysophospholipase L1-like esterase
VEHVDNTTDLVLLTIGGNDAGFPDLVQRCLLALAPKDAKNCQEALEYGFKQGPAVTEGVKGVIVELFSRMDGGGKVVVFEYPNIVADIPQFLTDKGRRFDNDVGPLVIDAAFGVRDLTQFGNAALAAAVDEANVELGMDFAMIYNKTPAVFAGHEPHPGLLKLNKDGWFWEFNTRRIGEMFHPNPEGQKQWGAAVAKEGIFGLDLGGTMRQRELANIGLSAWAGDEYAGFVGEPILFDASGSYDDSGLELVSFEWDFNNDGTFDMTTKSATVFYVYGRSFSGKMSVRVTNEKGQVATDWGTVHVRGKALAESS